MGKSCFRAVDAAMVRVTACDAGSLPWPEGPASSDTAALHGFIKAAWAVDGLASAVALASPSLATAVAMLLRDDTLSPDKAARAAMALARYVVRIRGRATPFGLFAGAAPAWGSGRTGFMRCSGHQPAVRADGQWLAALVTRLEGCAAVRQRLRVRVNDLIAVRGDRVIVTWLPHASAVTRKGPVEISLHRTPPVEAVLRMAQSSVDVVALTARLAAELAAVDTSGIDALVGQLIACGALVSNLRPPSTVTDGLGYVLAALDDADVSDLPAAANLVAALRNVRSELGGASVADLGGCADRMRALAEVPAHPVAVDLRAGDLISVPGRVAAEAAAAATALVRLSPHPRGTTGWRDYHARFLDRYGAGATVMVGDLVDPVAGLGLPGHFTSRPPAGQERAWSPRDERLAVLAQQAARDGAVEVVLDDADVAALTGPQTVSVRPAPHMDISVEVRAASSRAIGAGEFEIVVCGVGRTGMATSGRFLHLLSGDERAWLADVYRALPTGTHAALAAQLSFPPHHPRAENVTRVPQVLPYLVSVAEHRDEEPGQIPLGDLAVTADLDRFYLFSLSRRMVVEPALACSPAWHVVPPVARLLFELPRADCAAVGLFDWGGAACLPFLPRLRTGRVVLSPARWRVRAGDLPGRKASWGEWTSAVSGLRQRLRLPAWVSVGSGDRQLRLDLGNAMDLAVLRTHLGTVVDCVVFTESWAPEDHAWCGGRSHELVVPLASTAPPLPTPKALARRRPVISREHGHLPGSGVLSARLYSHPELFDVILARHVPDLVDGLDELSHWWFLRYRDPRHHLRLRLHVRDYGQAAERVGGWAAALRSEGLAGDLLLDTYRPEVARFGGGTAMSAAELLFAADSAAALAQLNNAGVADPLALTAASLADLAGAVLNDRQAGLWWLADHPGPRGPAPLDRTARLQAVAMVQPHPGGDPVPADVRRAWDARADAATRYAGLLGEWGREPASVIESLLHLHHNRVHGTDCGIEGATYRLARAAALSRIAQRATAIAGPP